MTLKLIAVAFECLDLGFGATVFFMFRSSIKNSCLPSKSYNDGIVGPPPPPLLIILTAGPSVL